VISAVQPRAIAWLLASALSVTVAHPAESPPAQELSFDSDTTVELAAESPQTFRLSLPAGSAADVSVIQREGFVDLEISEGTSSLKVRTESGVAGRIDSTLLGKESTLWLVTLAPRKGKGPGTVELRLSPQRPASYADRLKASAFAHYVEAEGLRFKNYRETAVMARPAEINERTRGAYETALSEYTQANDGCAVRRTQIGLARMQVALESYAEARATAQAALDADCADDLAEQAQALKSIGMAAAYQGDNAESADAAEQALALYRKTGDLRYEGVVLGNLSAVYMQLGATERALDAARGALQAALDTADSQGVVFGQKSIADIHLARGEFANAVQDYRTTLATLARTPYPMVEAETWNDLGILYHRMADPDESLKAYATAGALWQRMGSRSGEADTRINKAETLLELGDRRAAFHEFETARSIAHADGLRSIETRALRGSGAISLAENKPGDATRYYSRSLTLARASGEIAAQSYALRGLADVDLRQGAVKAALHKDQAALDLVRSAGDRDGEAATLAQLARAEERAGEIHAARRDIDRALVIVQRQRGQIDEPSLRASYFAAMRAYPDTQIDVLMHLEAREPGGHYMEQALVAAEEARVRSLQDRLAEKAIHVSRSLSPELAESLHAAEDTLRIAAFQLGRPSASSSSNRASLLAAFDGASHRLDEVRGRVRSANPRYAELTQPVEPSVPAMQKTLLDDDVAVLEYWLGPKQSYVWILTRRSVRAVRLPSRPDVDRFAGELVALLRAPPARATDQSFDALVATNARARGALENAAGRLARVLSMPEVLKNLPRKISIVADGSLQAVPFGLLPGGEGRRLENQHDITYLPSIMTLKWLRRGGGMAERLPSLAVFAAPQTDAAWAPLPYSQGEAEAIADLVPKDRVWLATGAEASRDNVLATPWERYTIVHFAAHAIVDARRPEISGIALSSAAGRATADDGVLRMNDIYNLDMPVDLVVLSGCETAAGRDLDAEGIFSLSRAFFYAGAPRVLASLWPVEDRATSILMPEFYRALLVEHMSPASALRVAQERLAQDARWQSPYYWAGFVLQGDWN
jgi:tetratricopeptide (TPR) repeat protein